MKRFIATFMFFCMPLGVHAGAAKEIPKTLLEFGGIQLGMSEAQLLKKFGAKEANQLPEGAGDEEKKAVEEALKQAKEEEYKSFEISLKTEKDEKDEKTVKVQVDLNEKVVYKVFRGLSPEDFAQRIAAATLSFGPPTRSQIYYNNYYVGWNDEKNQRSIILSLSIDVLSLTMKPAAGSTSDLPPTSQQMPQFTYSEISLLDMELIKKKVERLKQKEPKTEQKPEENPAVSPQPQP